MTIKRCSCGNVVTTKNSKFLGRTEEMLWFNCLRCQSTLTITTKKQQEEIKRFYEAKEKLNA